MIAYVNDVYSHNMFHGNRQETFAARASARRRHTAMLLAGL